MSLKLSFYGQPSYCPLPRYNTPKQVKKGCATPTKVSGPPKWSVYVCCAIQMMGNVLHSIEWQVHVCPSCAVLTICTFVLEKKSIWICLWMSWHEVTQGSSLTTARWMVIHVAWNMFLGLKHQLSVSLYHQCPNTVKQNTHIRKGCCHVQMWIKGGGEQQVDNPLPVFFFGGGELPLPGHAGKI